MVIEPENEKQVSTSPNLDKSGLAMDTDPIDEQLSSQQPVATSSSSEGEQIKKLEDDLLRLQAEKLNLAKRMRADIERAEKRGVEQVVSGLLEVADSLERSLEQKSGNLDAIQEGVRMTLTQLQNIMVSNGIEPIEPSPGSKLDPNLHMAIMQEASDVTTPNMIIRTEIKGYRINQRILRSAQVVVASASEKTDSKLTSTQAGTKDSNNIEKTPKEN